MTTELVRPTEENDIPCLARIEAVCFSEPWSERSLYEMLHNEYGRLLSLSSSDGAVVGYAGMYLYGEDADVTNIAVLPEYRGRGLGRMLLSALEDTARENGVSNLRLEVRVSNDAAIGLYEAFGYVRDGVRKHYYKKPAEDALLLSHRL